MYLISALILPECHLFVLVGPKSTIKLSHIRNYLPVVIGTAPRNMDGINVAASKNNTIILVAIDLLTPFPTLAPLPTRVLHRVTRQVVVQVLLRLN